MTPSPPGMTPTVDRVRVLGRDMRACDTPGDPMSDTPALRHGAGESRWVPVDLMLGAAFPGVCHFIATRKPFHYRVRAYSGTVNSAYSNVASATTPR